jgi:hypothetical protein
MNRFLAIAGTGLVLLFSCTENALVQVSVAGKGSLKSQVTIPAPGSNCLFNQMSVAVNGQKFVFLPDSGYNRSIRDSLVIWKTVTGFKSSLFLRGSRSPETCSFLVLGDTGLTGRNDTLPYNYKLLFNGCLALIESYLYDGHLAWEGPTYWSLKSVFVPPAPPAPKCLIDKLASAAVGQRFVFSPVSGYNVNIRDSLVIWKTVAGFKSSLFLRGSRSPETCSYLTLNNDSTVTGRNDTLPYDYSISLTSCYMLVESYLYDGRSSWEGPTYWSLRGEQQPPPPPPQVTSSCLAEKLMSANEGQRFVFLPDSGYNFEIRDSLVIWKTTAGFKSSLFLRGSRSPETCSFLTLNDSTLTGRNDTLPYNYKLILVKCNLLTEYYLYDASSWEGPGYWRLREDLTTGELRR